MAQVLGSLLMLMKIRRRAMEMGFTGAYSTYEKDPEVLRLLSTKATVLPFYDTFIQLKRRHEAQQIIFDYTPGPPPSNLNVNVELIRKNQVTISSMLNSVDEILCGKFLLCRTIGPPVKFTALITVVDDPEGKLAARIALYNYLPSVATTLAQYNEILPVGTILAIKNPLLKQSKDGGLDLHVDNPIDVVVMDEQALQKLNPDLNWLDEIPAQYAKFMKKKKPKTEKKTTEHESFKHIGNKHFAAAEYAKAIAAYTTGLETQPEDASLLGNRATAYLNLEMFDLALADAEEILKTNPTNKKGIARKARALWGLKQFQAVKDFLTEKIRQRELQNDKDIQEFHKRAEMFFQQATFGNYPKEIHCIWNKVKEDSIDWADYEGDIIVKDTDDGRGRGLFATKDITAGQLILASKAFAFVSYLTKSDAFASNSEADSVSHAELISKLARILKNNPSKGNKLYKLYAGPDLKYLDSERGDDCSIIDMKRMEAICKYNAFGVYCQMTEQREGSGLWILPSFINHNCIDCNAVQKIHGDFVFIRAFKDIKAGEEIIHPYQRPTLSYANRQLYFQNNGFQCNCQLCEYDRQESQAVAEKQEGILNKLHFLQDEENDDHSKSFSNEAMRKVMPLFEQFLKIRPKYRFALVANEIIEKFPFFKNKDYNKSVKYLKIKYEILKDTPLCQEALDTITGIILCLINACRIKEAQAWEPVMRAAAVAANGSWDVVYNNNKDLIQFWKMSGVNI